VIKGRRRDRPDEPVFREQVAAAATGEAVFGDAGAEGPEGEREASLLDGADAARIAEYEADLLAGEERAETLDADAYFDED